MDEKVYFLTNDNREYSHEEITALIFAGKLVKRSLIWEKSLPNWIHLEECADFIDIFKEYDREAEEKFKKAAGKDEETLKKREMKKMFDSVSEEEIKTTTDWKYIFKWIVSGIFILVLPFIYFAISNLVRTGHIFEESEEEHIESININDLKYRSGLIRIDEVKGVAIKRVERNEEDKILQEVILQMRREDAEKKQKEEKKPEKSIVRSSSLFDKVSDEELNAFRQSLLQKTGGRRVEDKAAGGTAFAQGGQIELTSKQVNEVLKQNSSTIRHCYERALKLDVGIRGRMEVTLHILGNGKVAKVVNNTPRFKGTEMERCVDEMIRTRWQFPSFEGTMTTVTVPFVLTAQ